MTEPVATCELCKVPMADPAECIPYRLTEDGAAAAELGEPGTRALCIDCASYFAHAACPPLRWLQRAIDGLLPRDDATAKEQGG